MLLQQVWTGCSSFCTVVIKQLLMYKSGLHLKCFRLLWVWAATTSITKLGAVLQLCRNRLPFIRRFANWGRGNVFHSCHNSVQAVSQVYYTWCRWGPRTGGWNHTADQHAETIHERQHERVITQIRDKWRSVATATGETSWQRPDHHGSM